ncbi:MAG: methyl-accepting chemotaxis protein, partial [Rhodocyclales bacterium]|nr:methyl-accepting chemotaxis protein [Rhodocyclales bacterium]
MFQNMKVATKLALGFGLVVALMLLISFIGITRMAHLNESLRLVGEERWPRANMATDIVVNSNTIGIALRNMMLSNSRDDMQRQKEAVLETRQLLGGVVEKLKEVIQNPKGKELMQQIIENRQRYVAGQEKLIGLIEAGDSEGARNYLNTELRPILRTYQASANALAKFQGELLDQGVKEAQETYESARTLMIASVVAALVLAVIAALLIIRGLSRQLGGEPFYAADIARQVANGDMTVEVELRGNDTTSLLAAMKDMVQKLSATLGEVRTAADSLAACSEEVSATSQTLAQGSSEQAASLEETTASIEQMSASIGQNTDNAKVTDGIASKSAGNATDGGQAVRATV